MRWLALGLILCIGCTRKYDADLKLIFNRASNSWEAGDLDKALAEADHGFNVALQQQDQKEQWRFRLLRCDVLAMNRRPEEITAALANPIPNGPDFAVLAARKIMFEGRVQGMLGHQAEAETLLEQAHHAAEAAGAEDVVLEVEIIQGPIVGALRGAEEGERILTRALLRARTMHLPFSEANILQNLGVIRSRKFRWEEAATFFEQALAVSKPEWKVLYSVAQNNLAVCYQRLGEYDRAIAIQREAITRHERSGAKVYLLGALRSAGESYLNKGELAEAIPYLERALNLASEMGRTLEAAITAGNLAKVFIERGDWQRAEALNEEAIRLKKAANSNTGYYNTLNAGQIAAGRGDANRAMQLYKQVLSEAKDDPGALWDAHEQLGFLAAQRQDTAAALREFEAAVSLIEKTRADLLRTEFKLPFLTRRIRLYQRYVDVLIEAGQIERALAVADSSRAQVLAEKSGAAPVRRLMPGAYSELARRSGAVLLSYWLAPVQSHAWVVTAKQIHHILLPPAEQIEPLVAQYQDAIERLVDPLRTPVLPGEKLYQILIAPLRQYLPPGSRVIAVPDGALYSVNLEALPVPGEPAHYFINDVTLEIAPSLSAMDTELQPTPAHRLLLLGDPPGDSPSFPALAYASREITSVRQTFAPSDQVVLTGESATPQAFLAAATGPLAAIHFTAHAVANRENPLESAVLLSRGKLYARDVMNLRLQADLVTVSACRGAGERIYSGEGLVGFAWAFLRAGARQVIAGLWDVNDQSTAGLMDSLYRKLAAGKRPPDALRAAKLEMIESPGNLRKPYYWAPFQLYTIAR